MTTRPDPWERQPGETDPAFHAFAVYRDMGPERSLSKVAGSIGKSTRLLSGWSSRNSWRVRVNAWDAELDRLDQVEVRSRRKEMRDRHVTLASKFQEKIDGWVEALSAEKLEAIDPNVVIRWLEVSAKVERAALGEPDRVAVTTSKGADRDNELDLTSLTDEQIRDRLEELHREIGNDLADYAGDLDEDDAGAEDLEEVDA